MQLSQTSTGCQIWEKCYKILEKKVINPDTSPLSIWQVDTGRWNCIQTVGTKRHSYAHKEYFGTNEECHSVMDRAFDGINSHFAGIYLDDILVYSHDFGTFGSPETGIQPLLNSYITAQMKEM